MAQVDTLILLTSGYFAGKTAAFCIPLLEKLKTEETHVQGLIIVPTRELALQTSSVVKELGAHMDVR